MYHYIKTFTSSFPIISVLFFSVFLSSPTAEAKSNKDEGTRTLVHLLDYIASDYTQAIKSGQIINEFEYKEMQEFAGRVQKLYRGTRAQFAAHDTTLLIEKFDKLKHLIKQKAPTRKVIHQARTINQQVRNLSNIKLTPSKWPNLAKGQRIYKEKCTRCHGKTGQGDGAIASTLNPPPTNFVEDKRVVHISPFQAYNTTRLGVEGTSMTPFKELSDQEVWQVAFYVLSLRHRPSASLPKDTLRKIFEQASGEISLKEAALLSDQALLDTLSGSKSLRLKKVSAIRLHQVLKPTTSQRDNTQNTLATAHQKLDSALVYYQQKQYEKASSVALYAYLDGIEPVEPHLRLKSKKIVNQVEADMAAVRNAIKKRKDYKTVKATVKEAHKTLDAAAQVLSSDIQSYWLTFGLTVGILLREGLEACLIIIVILSIIRAAKAPHAAKWVHGGWMSAVFVGLLGWFFTDWIISIGVKNRELAEAIASFVAVGVLLYVGYWLHNKTKASQWKKFIEEKLQKLLNEKNMIGLAGLSFIVVFREAFETVLFLSALQLEAGESGSSAIGLATLSSFIGILVLAWAMLKYSLKLPIRQLFAISSIIVGILAIILVGKGMHALQEVNIISTTFTDLPLRSDLFGIYPTYESMTAQIIVFISAFLPWTGWINKIKRKGNKGD